VSIVLVYITTPSREVAKDIAKKLLRKRLIACANIQGTGASLYWWKGKIAKEKEAVLFAKTTKSKIKAVEKAVRKMHPYETPCIITIPVKANKDFSEWVKKEVR
jgi:periplasmic divalent cation tolerance protein